MPKIEEHAKNIPKAEENRFFLYTAQNHGNSFFLG